MSLETKPGSRPAVFSELALEDRRQVSLCEVLDRVLNKGVVVTGEATISVADIDLIYLGLQIVLTSMETARASVGRVPVRLGAGLGVRKERASGIT
ncbi:MAG: gas vesicle protein [Acidobacteriia bacterium]|nr:gas vesicle protein [Terriglobia bacterium]